MFWMTVSLDELKHKILELLRRDEEFRYAVAGLLGLEEILRRLGEHDRKFNEILSVLKSHGEMLKIHGERLQEHDRKFNEVITEIRELRRDFSTLSRDFSIMRRELSGLASTVGAISEGGARRALREWLREKGLKADRLKPVTVVVEGEEREINFYGEAVDMEGRKTTIYAEAKSTIRAREVFEFAKTSKEAEKTYGRGIKAIIAYRIYEDAYKAAEEEEINIIEA